MSESETRTVHVPPTTLRALPGPGRYRWRRLLARIRQNYVVYQPTTADIQPNDLVVAFFSGPTPPGWTQVEGSPGVHIRTWQQGDV